MSWFELTVFEWCYIIERNRLDKIVIMTDKAKHSLVLDIGKTHIKLHVLNDSFDSVSSKQMKNIITNFLSSLSKKEVNFLTIFEFFHNLFILM